MFLFSEFSYTDGTSIRDPFVTQQLIFQSIQHGRRRNGGPWWKNRIISAYRKNRKIGPVLRIYIMSLKNTDLQISKNISSMQWLQGPPLTSIDHVSFQISQSFSFPDLQRRMMSTKLMTMVTRLGALLRGKRLWSDSPRLCHDNKTWREEWE